MAVTISVRRDGDGFTVDLDAGDATDDDLFAGLLAHADWILAVIMDERQRERVAHALCVLCSAERGEN